jgi:hypothetical protein
VAAHGSVGRVVTAGAVKRRPTSGCTGRRSSTLFRSFELRRAAPVNLSVGFLLMQMAKLISMSLLLFGSFLVAPAQQPSTELSYVDKAGIVESVLEVELRNQQSFPDFAYVRNVSSENIQFMATSQFTKHGFTLVASNQLCEWQARRVERFLVFKKFSLRDGIVVIGLSRVTGGRSCFDGRFYSELSYTYEARQTSDGWITELTRRPMPNFFAERKRLNTAR